MSPGKVLPHCALVASTFNEVDDFGSVSWILVVFEAVNESISVKMNSVVKISRFRTNLNGKAIGN